MLPIILNTPQMSSQGCEMSLGRNQAVSGIDMHPPCQHPCGGGGGGGRGEAPGPSRGMQFKGALPLHSKPAANYSTISALGG